MIDTIKNFKNINFYEAISNFLKMLNIPINEITTQFINANNVDTLGLEIQLENMIYNLYGLSEDKIDIVEGR